MPLATKKRICPQLSGGRYELITASIVAPAAGPLPRPWSQSRPWLVLEMVCRKEAFFQCERGRDKCACRSGDRSRFVRAEEDACEFWECLAIDGERFCCVFDLVCCNCWALLRNMTPKALSIINFASFFSFCYSKLSPLAKFLLKSLVFVTVIKSQK